MYLSYVRGWDVFKARVGFRGGSINNPTLTPPRSPAQTATHTSVSDTRVLDL